MSQQQVVDKYGQKILVLTRYRFVVLPSVSAIAILSFYPLPKSRYIVYPKAAATDKSSSSGSSSGNCSTSGAQHQILMAPLPPGLSSKV